MTYQAEISRANPTAFLFLIDQSGSMADVFRQSDTPMRKDVFVAEALNRTLHNLVIRCNKNEGIRDYFHLSIIGYGGQVAPILGGSLQGQTSIPISILGASPERIEDRMRKEPDGAGGFIDKSVKFPIWVDPVSQGGTPMCAAFTQAIDVLRDWIAQHRAAFSPMVFHFTDGESTDGSPVDLARELTSLSTDDGQVLLYNVHVSATSPFPLRFPKSTDQMPDAYASQLLSISSPLIPRFADLFSASTGQVLSTDNRCLIYNAGPEEISDVMDIGTRLPLR